MTRTGRLVGGVLVATAVLLLVVTSYALRAPVVTADGGTCASVWHVHRQGGASTGGFTTDAERRAGAEVCRVAGEPGWRRAQVLGSATGAVAVGAAVVLHLSNRRRSPRRAAGSGSPSNWE